jgi:hypothetical protein
MSLILMRLRRIALLDLDVLDDVRLDPRATVPALAVAVVSIALLGLGGWLWWLESGLGDRTVVLIKSVGIGTAFSVAAWLVWLLVATVVLQMVGHVAVDVGQLVRAAGFACAPLALALLMAVRPIAFGAGLVALAGWVAATQIAVQRVSGRAGREALLANVAGFGAWALVMSLLTTGQSPFGPGPFLAEAIWEAVTGRAVFFAG